MEGSSGVAGAPGEVTVICNRCGNRMILSGDPTDPVACPVCYWYHYPRHIR
jgi:hypothetical protein